MHQPKIPPKCAKSYAIAPMMDWTDRHCRYFHRLISPHALLYTEMLSADAVIHGDCERLLRYDATEHPVALQLGGSDPYELACATDMGVAFGYDEINLNVGCPSDRVKSGRFGAILMRDPKLVARCCAAMLGASQGRTISIKCRIGVDEQIPEQILPAFIREIAAVGVQKFIIHARMAHLSGLSPKDNRTIPPLNYDLVHKIKRDFPELSISLNGGLCCVKLARKHLEAGLDGVMFGRAAYYDPYTILSAIECQLNPNYSPPSRQDIVALLIPYIKNHIDSGGRLHHITRHILGLFSGQTGARHWRRALSGPSVHGDADHNTLLEALAHLKAIPAPS